MPNTELNKFVKIFMAAEKEAIWVKVPHSGDPQVLNGGSCENLPVLTRVGPARVPCPWVLHHNLGTKTLVPPSSSGSWCSSWAQSGSAAAWFW